MTTQQRAAVTLQAATRSMLVRRTFLQQRNTAIKVQAGTFDIRDIDISIAIHIDIYISIYDCIMFVPMPLYILSTREPILTRLYIYICLCNMCSGPWCHVPKTFCPHEKTSARVIGDTAQCPRVVESPIFLLIIIFLILADRGTK
jgi:hypothetical protein